MSRPRSVSHRSRRPASDEPAGADALVGSAGRARALEAVAGDAGLVGRAAGGPRREAAAEVLATELVGSAEHARRPRATARAGTPGTPGDAIAATEPRESVRCVHPPAGDPAVAPHLARPRDPIAAFEHLIAARSGRRPSVPVTVLARSGEAAFAGSTPALGPLLDLAPRLQRSHP